MYSLKKKMIAVLSAILTLAMLAPAVAASDAAKAADTDLGFTAKVEAESGSARNSNVFIEGVEKVYVDTVQKNGKISTEIYKAGEDEDTGKSTDEVFIDLSYLNGKETELQIYADEDKAKLTVKVEKQEKNVKAKFDAEKNAIKVTVGGAEKANGYGVVIGRDYCGNVDIGEDDYWKDTYEKYMVKGASGYVYVPAQLKVEAGADESYRYGKQFCENINRTKIISITPASRQAKFRIPARKNGPKIAFDLDKLSFTAPKDCTYNIIQAAGGDELREVSGKSIIISGGALYATKSGIGIDWKWYAQGTKIPSKAGIAVVSGNGIYAWPLGIEEDDMPSNGKNTCTASVAAKTQVSLTSKAVSEKKIDIARNEVTIELYKNARGSVPASKATELVIPRQEEFPGVVGTTIKVEEQKKKASRTATEATILTGYKITNDTGKDCQFAVIAKQSNLDEYVSDLVTNKIKWKTVKNGRSVVYKAGKLSGQAVICRTKGIKENKKSGVEMVLPSKVIEVTLKTE